MSLTSSTVRASWARIDAWLRTHAPASARLLAPPANPDEVERVQVEMAVRFPEDLLESLGCHDGLVSWANILPEQPPIPLAEIVSFWRMSVEIAGDDPDLCEPHEEGGEPWWHPQWIPWAQSDGDSQVIDMREGPQQGRVGSAAHDETASFADGWPSLSAYLNDVADVLDHGGTVGPWAPFLTTDGELWWSSEGETELNGLPLAPAPTSQGG
ncbi:SMI1/KNR4 family protein [Streptomyces sp. NPDC091682]|uniref:SMI1/KNR4 family protein n=1 Tax=Streptomyces sp. NPDC091682 TaxID=3366005 RepID=UPI0037F67160